MLKKIIALAIATGFATASFAASTAPAGTAAPAATEKKVQASKTNHHHRASARVMKVKHRGAATK
ncbi:MAG: hypothetical protein H6R10_3225 [Rhodocyclaceae bacterium]|nr:hypothetical protein [Rhodocyclaceae bacterium]